MEKTNDTKSFDFERAKINQEIKTDNIVEEFFLRQKQKRHNKHLKKDEQERVR